MSLGSRNCDRSLILVEDVHEFTSVSTASSEFIRINSPAVAFKEPALEVVKVDLIIRIGLTVFTVKLKLNVSVPNDCTNINQVEILL